MQTGVALAGQGLGPLSSPTIASFLLHDHIAIIFHVFVYFPFEIRVSIWSYGSMELAQCKHTTALVGLVSAAP